MDIGISKGPGPPLSNLETRALLEELYKMSGQPSLPTSSVPKKFDISHTENVSHVYVKVDTPTGL